MTKFGRQFGSKREQHQKHLELYGAVIQFDQFIFCEECNEPKLMQANNFLNDILTPTQTGGYWLAFHTFSGLSDGCSIPGHVPS